MNDFVNNLFEKTPIIILNFIADFFRRLIELYYDWQPSLEHTALVISGILIWSIIYYMLKMDVFTSSADKYAGALGANVPKRKAIRAWLSILNKLRTRKSSEMKSAIKEADKIFDELIKGMGIKGANMDERMGQLNEGEIANLADLVRAHSVNKRIADEPDFEISYSDAKGIIGTYQVTFKDFGLID